MNEPSEIPKHEVVAQKRQRTLSTQNIIIMALTVGGWLITLGREQVTVSDQGSRIEKLEQGQSDQQKTLLRIAERVGAKPQ